MKSAFCKNHPANPRTGDRSVCKDCVNAEMRARRANKSGRGGVNGRPRLDGNLIRAENMSAPFKPYEYNAMMGALAKVSMMPMVGV